MKKLLFIVIIAILFFVFAGCSIQNNTNCLRIHIRANSNDEVDQQIKYLVKDEVVSFLTPLLANATDKQKAKQIVLQNKDQICKIADDLLQKNGFDYCANARLDNEFFPTRSYNDVVFEKGEYDALIVDLGSGNGDNWWCVVYPPLCFVGGEITGENLVYKSKLQEIIQKFFG